MDPGQAPYTGPDKQVPHDFQAIEPAFRVLQLNVEGLQLSAAKRQLIGTIAQQHADEAAVQWIGALCISKYIVIGSKESSCHWISSSVLANCKMCHPVKAGRHGRTHTHPQAQVRQYFSFSILRS